MSRVLPRLLRWLAAALILLIASSTLLVAIGWWIARPEAVDAFYTPPPDVPAQPGQLVRQEPYARHVPAGAQGWRILYTTTRGDGSPAVASAVVIANTRAMAAGPMPTIAWMHGTTGTVPACAPSVLDDPIGDLPAFGEWISGGWAYVGTDYPGLGTSGPHPYLIGEGEARAGLDAVRAARHLPGLRLGERTVFWGHSQGGHAALWAGIIAPAYAPDVPLAGVAALAPATDLPSFFGGAHPPFGRIVSSMTLDAYQAAYPDVRIAEETDGWLRRFLVSDIASRCVSDHAAVIASHIEARLMQRSPLDRPLDGSPFGRRLRENIPDGRIQVPVFIAQGEADDLIGVGLQDRWVAQRCAQGQALTYRRYPGRGHVTLLEPDSPLLGDLLPWTEARFAGEPADDGCADVPR